MKRVYSIFFTLEKRHQSANCIAKHVNERDVASIDTVTLNLLKTCYSKIYSSNNPNCLDIKNYLFNNHCLNIVPKIIFPSQRLEMSNKFIKNV